MFIGISTTGEILSIGLQAESGRFLGTHTLKATRSLSENIPAAIETLCRDTGVLLSEASGIGVIAGPGGYTSLRIGVTIANTIAGILNIPAYGISTFEAMLYAYREIEGLFLTVMPGRTAELNAALWNTHLRQPQRLCPDICLPYRRVEKLFGTLRGPLHLIGQIPDEIRTMAQEKPAIRIIETFATGSAAASIARERYQANMPQETVKPVYSHQPYIQKKMRPSPL